MSVFSSSSHFQRWLFGSPESLLEKRIANFIEKENIDINGINNIQLDLPQRVNGMNFLNIKSL